MNIKIKKLDERAVIPSYAHEGDVCMDMTAIDVEYDYETDTYIYHTGLAFESDYDIGQFLFPRSSNCKKECYLTNSVGVADSAIYRGEIQFRYKNRTSREMMATLAGLKATAFSTVYKGDAYVSTYDDIVERTKKLEFAPYKAGERIGQMVFMTRPRVTLEVVDELSDTVRGDGGFGSTGK